MTKWDRASFVAWDGEGVTVRKRHQYIMLRNSLGLGATDPEGLSTERCLRAIVDGMELAGPDVWHIGFAFSYDVNMIVRDLARYQLLKLHRGGWVRYGRYRLQFRRMKSFTVQRLEGDEWHGGTIWDTFGFFQSSFVAACEKYAIGTPHVRQAVAEMKQARSTFKKADLTAIERYCESECELLVQLLTVMKGYLNDAGLKIVRWDGAGAVAAALLAREGVKAMKGTAPAHVQAAVQFAFAGGRIELLRYGHLPNREIHHYDINSAYPQALRGVPCLAHGAWRASDRPSVASLFVRRSDFALYRVRFSYPAHQLHPFFWRAPDGRIFYPRRGEGWYWEPEVRAALSLLRPNVGRVSSHDRRFGGRFGRRQSQRFDSMLGSNVASREFFPSVELIESLTWEPECDHQPFAFIPDLYRQRQEWKQAGRGAEKVLKLGLNSLYGKCAQHIGGTEVEPPSWHQLEWAGYTTSYTRAALYLAAMQAPNDIIFIATDGIYSLVPLDLPLGKGLGEWDYQRHTGITAVQSGVYWVDDAKGTSSYYRGFDPGSLDRRNIVAAWRARKASYRAESTRFVTLGQALQGGSMWGEWRQWRTSPRVLQLSPAGTKRIDAGRSNPARGLVPTAPYDPSWEGLALGSTAASLPWSPTDGPLPLDEDEVEIDDGSF